MQAWDTETTGKDFWHGALPYFVTMCDENNNQMFWEWDVDPLTRKPLIPAEDLSQILSMITVPENPDCPLILHNTRFDFMVLQAAHNESLNESLESDSSKEGKGAPNGKRPVKRAINVPRIGSSSKPGDSGTFDKDGRIKFPWGRVRDTLLAGHLLCSNQPHNLYSMALVYLGMNVSKFEDELEDACKKARAYVKKQFPLWDLAEAGKPHMPSLKKSAQDKQDRAWKQDAWLLKALDKRGCAPKEWKGKSGDGLVADYANTDSAVTRMLWPVLEEQLKKKGLWEIYLTRCKLLPVAYKMEYRGLSISRKRLYQQLEKFQTGVETSKTTCVSLASKYGYDLEMPKSGNNNSLLHFCFGRPIVDENKKVIGRSQQWLNLPVVMLTDTGNPSLDKDAMALYKNSLPKESDQLEFVTALSASRSQSKAVEALTGYTSFWVPTKLKDWMVLHPNLNPTGTDTLRWSSKCPNLQNISKKEDFNLRYPFGPAPGREHWSLDYKNIELRIPAYESGEQSLIDLFEKCNEPPFFGSEHLLNFSVVYPEIWAQELPYQMVDPEHIKKKYKATNYQWCKNGDFAIGYNCGKAKADATFRRDGAFDALKSRFAKKERLNQKQIAHARKYGYVETIPDKTVCPDRGYPLMCKRTENGGVLTTVPLNYHVQGTAMWITGKAMIRVQELFDQWNREAGSEQYHIALQVHDELFIDMPKRKHPKESPAESNLGRIRVVQRLMEQCGDDVGIPTPVGVEYHSVEWSSGDSV